MPTPLFTLAATVLDGDFSTPQEINGSALISTDPVTRAKTVTRLYVVWKAYYTPLIYGSFVAIKDRQYPNCILIEEVPQSVDAPFFYFQRIYSEIPAARDEPLVYAFSMPGKSAVTLSALTHQAVNWRPYGNGSPYTRAILANAAYSYAAGDPGPNGSLLFTIPTLSRIIFNSFSGPISVDYVGTVYEYAGTRAITSQSGGITVLTGAEPNFVLVGSTIPPSLPATWIAEANVRRWRGSIWELEVITVPTV